MVRWDRSPSSLSPTWYFVGAWGTSFSHVSSMGLSLTSVSSVRIWRILMLYNSWFWTGFRYRRNKLRNISRLIVTCITRSFLKRARRRGLQNLKGIHHHRIPSSVDLGSSWAVAETGSRLRTSCLYLNSHSTLTRSWSRMSTSISPLGTVKWLPYHFPRFFSISKWKVPSQSSNRPFISSDSVKKWNILMKLLSINFRFCSPIRRDPSYHNWMN